VAFTREAVAAVLNEHKNRYPIDFLSQRNTIFGVFQKFSALADAQMLQLGACVCDGFSHNGMMNCRNQMMSLRSYRLSACDKKL
jgi:hypothetical protein